MLRTNSHWHGKGCQWCIGCSSSLPRVRKRNDDSGGCICCCWHHRPVSQQGRNSAWRREGLLELLMSHTVFRLRNCRNS